MPASWYELTGESTWNRLVRGLAIAELRLEARDLLIRGHAGLTPDSGPNLRLALSKLGADEAPAPNRRFPHDLLPPAWEWPVSLRPTTPGAPAELTAALPLREVIPSAAAESRRWSVRLRARVGEWTYDLPLRRPDAEHNVVLRKGLRDHLITVTTGAKNEVVLTASSAARMSWPRQRRTGGSPTPENSVGLSG